MGKLEKKISLKPFNTFGLDVQAKHFSVFKSTEEAKELLKAIDTTEDDLLILGGGSNILFTQDYKGYVLKNEIKGITIEDEDDNTVTLKVGGGDVWHEFVLYCMENNYGGLENMSLIPGTVGAAPIQNIGAYGVEQKDYFVKLDALHIGSGEMKTFSAEECKFGYRDSFFKGWGKGQYIISQVYYKLTKANHNMNVSYGAIEEVLSKKGISSPTIKDISDVVISIRRSKLPDPNQIGNAGSFFKNPVVDVATFNAIKENYPGVKSYPIDEHSVKIPAGWLIEEAGWKGQRFDGDYGVHKNQSLVLVNYGKAKGKDIKGLALNIILDIKEKFGIELMAEVNII